MEKTRLQDIPSGHNGTGYINIGGRVVTAFRISKVSAGVDAIKDSKRFLQETMTQNAVRGLDGKLNITYYNNTSALVEAVRDYKNGGNYPDISVQYYAENKASGRQEVTLTGVILDSISFGELDDGSDSAQVISSAGTFDDFDIISTFKE